MKNRPNQTEHSVSKTPAKLAGTHRAARRLLQLHRLCLQKPQGGYDRAELRSISVREH